MLILLSALGVAGCGDAVLCDSSPLVVIQSPTQAVAGDGDSAAAGVQTDVRVRSSLLPGEGIELTVLDAAGASIATLREPAGEDGSALFQGVTVPEPRARLRAVALGTCGQAEDEVELDVRGAGCPIEVVAPTATVTADADGVPGNGSQVDVVLAVGEACVGRRLSATCGAGTPEDVVPPGGMLTLRADLCGSSPCQTQVTCTFQVSTPTGVPSRASALISFDDEGPAVGVALVQPAVPCGGQVSPASDVDPATDGVQLVARVTAAGGVNRALELTNTGGTAALPADGDVTVTVMPGVNVMTGVAEDALGNRGRSASCTVALADLAVTFAPPVADGLVGRRDGAVGGGGLALPLCGTVSPAGAAVSLRIDGGAPVPATVTGTDWCRTLALAEGPHAVTAVATRGTSFGRADLALRVDLTPPSAVTAFTGIAPTRQRVGLSWAAPSDGGAPAAGYIVKVATSALTEANFDTHGTILPAGAPQAPGAIELADVFPARLGTPYWLGVAGFDAAGNRAPAAIAGPITPAFDQLGPIKGPNQQLGALAMGAAIAHGKFNDDEFEDIAVAAPTQNAGNLTQAGAVYVYLGGPGGIAQTPAVSILGGAAGALAGSGLAAVRWKSATRDDLVIGAPGADGGAGRLYVFGGGFGFPTGTVNASSAALQIGAHPTAPGWFANGGLGAAVAAADVDGDGVRDLVASAIRGGGSGGVVVFYGGTVGASLALSSTDTSGFGTAIVEYLPDPLALPGRAFGTYLHAVEPTLGPLDPDDDLVVAYEDDVDSAGESVYVIRGNGTRPAASLTQRAFAPGRDVRIDLVLPPQYRISEFGAQAVSIADHNGDGAADLAISAYRHLNGAGQVLIIDGDTIGNNGVAKTNNPGVVLTTIEGGPEMRLGAALVAHDESADDDVDGDGQRDLLVGGVAGGVAHLFVWFGGTLPLGTTTTTASAGASIAGPSVFGLNAARPHGPAGQARWVGDTNGDGLDDICWASPYDNATGLDGAFAVLFDGAP